MIWRGRIIHTLSAVRALSSGSNQEPQAATIEAVEAVQNEAVQEADTYNQTRESIAKKN